MFVQLKCTACGQTFDYDSSADETRAECPHCNHANALPTAAAPAPPTVLHNAPNLVGTRPCPSCKAPLARDAILCVNCGFNLQTRKKADGAKLHFGLPLAIGLVAVVVAGGLIYLLQPDDAPPPPFTPSAPVATSPTPAPAAPSQPPPPDTTTAPAAEVTAPTPPAPPPKPTAEELAAQKAAAEEAAFQAKKAQAEQTLRLQLANREPPHQLNDTVELRQKNGVVTKGTFQGYGGADADRVILLATPTGQIGIPLNLLDPPSRRRVDPEYREAFIQHVLSTRTP